MEPLERIAEITRELQALDAEHRDRPLSDEAEKRWRELEDEADDLQARVGEVVR
jgi:hypothetical protein